MPWFDFNWDGERSTWETLCGLGLFYQALAEEEALFEAEEGAEDDFDIVERLREINAELREELCQVTPRQKSTH